MSKLPSTSSRPRVLIVEDEVILAWEIEDTLRSAGYDITGTAVSVDAALDLISAKGADVAVLDVNMSGHLSIPFTYELRRRNIPFVVCTAYSALLKEEMAALEGVAILTKPVDSNTLVMEVNRLLGRTEAEPEMQLP